MTGGKRPGGGKSGGKALGGRRRGGPPDTALFTKIQSLPDECCCIEKDGAGGGEFGMGGGRWQIDMQVLIVPHLSMADRKENGNGCLRVSDSLPLYTCIYPRPTKQEPCRSINTHDW